MALWCSDNPLDCQLDLLSCALLGSRAFVTSLFSVQNQTVPISPLLLPHSSPERQNMDSDHSLLFFLFAGGPLCSCCVPDPMGLSFLPPYGCQSNRTASVAALRMKAREHSEAVLQSANLLPSASSSPNPVAKSAPPDGSQDKTPSAKEQSEGEKSV